MQEILEALRKAYGIPVEDIAEERKRKYTERGGFEKRLFLEDEQKSS